MRRTPKLKERTAATPLRGDFATRPEWRRALREHRRGSVKPHYSLRDTPTQETIIRRVCELHNSRLLARLVNAGVPLDKAQQYAALSGKQLHADTCVSRMVKRVKRHYGLNKYHAAVRGA